MMIQLLKARDYCSHSEQVFKKKRLATKIGGILLSTCSPRSRLLITRDAIMGNCRQQRLLRTENAFKLRMSLAHM